MASVVNAASEGLRTVVLETVAPGGQAGTTSMIEDCRNADRMFPPSWGQISRPGQFRSRPAGG